ncbi:MAG: integrase arm-type DNA-binding domain-containing protein [Paracoccus sp. (in: a-proteobacteria)]|nr:integrase arm-type DNA-binding domain-containing protein [Paracoccus sp. (in: a-proteobacteria)]
MNRGIFIAIHSGKLTKNLVRTLGPGRHGDGDGLYLVVDPGGARRWIVRVTVKGQRNREGKPLRTDFGLGSADLATLNVARERALEYRRLARQGLNPRFHKQRDIPCFEELARQVHIERLPTWKTPAIRWRGCHGALRGVASLPFEPNRRGTNPRQGAAQRDHRFSLHRSREGRAPRQGHAAGLSAAELLREAQGLAQVRRRKPVPRVDPRLVLALGRIGGNLNQIARRANASALRQALGPQEALMLATALVSLDRQLAAIRAAAVEQTGC